MEAGDYPRHRRWQSDLAVDLPAGRLHQAETVDQLAADVAHAAIGVHEQEEEHDDWDQGDLGADTESEPQQEQRNQRQPWDAVERHDERLEHVARHLAGAQDEADDQPDQLPMAKPMNVVWNVSQTLESSTPSFCHCRSDCSTSLGLLT